MLQDRRHRPEWEQITQFNKNAVLTLPCLSDAALAAEGISKYQLVPVYCSTLVGQWILANNCVVDTERNEMTLRIDHFDKFGLASRVSRECVTYLPIARRKASQRE